MESLFQILCQAPGERLAVLLSTVFIGLLAAAVKQLWNRNRALEDELAAIHAAQRALVSRLIEVLADLEEDR